jgi:hypothetical protein
MLWTERIEGCCGDCRPLTPCTTAGKCWTCTVQISEDRLLRTAIECNDAHLLGLHEQAVHGLRLRSLRRAYGLPLGIRGTIPVIVAAFVACRLRAVRT